MESLNKKTVLITGASGFIGFNVLKAFYDDSKWKIYIIVNKSLPDKLKILNGINIIKGNLSEEKFLKEFCNKHSFDIIVHIAGLASDIGKDEIFRKINYEPVKYLLNISKEKFIFISSTDVYGIKDFNNADENTPLCEFPKNPYPKYKILAEKYIKEHCNSYILIRPAAVWGEDDKTLESRFVEFLRVSPFIVHFGKHKGKNRWPLANVNKISSVILKCSNNENLKNFALNIIDNEYITIDDYYNALAKKYFPDKKYKTLFLPFWTGKCIGAISTFISYILNLKHPLFDPTYYAVHHVSSNLDFNSDLMQNILDNNPVINKKIELNQNDDAYYKKTFDRL